MHEQSLVISFLTTTLIYVKRANGEFEDLTNQIKEDVKDELMVNV
ncbi:MAG: hypothetical protein ACNI3H_13455 [Halarcobacter ebronensis]